MVSISTSIFRARHPALRLSVVGSVGGTNFVSEETGRTNFVSEETGRTNFVSEETQRLG